MNSKFTFFTAKEIKPNGWMKKQLEIQAKGLAGNLDKVWPDVRDSAWVGGPAESWERGPYWLGGFVPLAYLLDDEDMKQRAKRYIDAILARQEPDGWICPVKEGHLRSHYDTWANYLICKSLLTYYQCSDDERIPDVIYRIMKNFHYELTEGDCKLFNWGKYRWFEGFITLNWLYERYHEEWIRDLARIFREQGMDYRTVEPLWKVPLHKWILDTHVVNLAMMLKCEAVSCDLLGEKYTDYVEKLYGTLTRYNGTPVAFTGDECLSGISPIQGTECCAIVELMYSFEQLYAYTGDRKWAERLENVAFNGLPGTMTDDMWAHQYDQQSNQIDCSPLVGGDTHPVFFTNNGDANVYGLEPHFGCCTANHGQGWPLLALSSFMKAKDGVVSAVPVPTELTTSYGDANVTVRLDTDYPFRNILRYTVTTDRKTDMKLYLRVPTFAENVTLNGVKKARASMLTVDGFEAGKTVVTLSFTVRPSLVPSPTKSLRYARYGSLIFSLPIEANVTLSEYVKHGTERKFPYCDYIFKPKSDWNYGYTGENLTVEEHPMTDVPFDSEHPALTLKTKVSRIDWGYEYGYDTVASRLPHHRKPLDEPREAELYPYGCAKLRMTELPLIK